MPNRTDDYIDRLSVPQISLLSSPFLGVAAIVIEELTPVGKYIKVSKSIKNLFVKTDIKRDFARALERAASQAWNYTKNEIGGNSAKIINKLRLDNKTKVFQFNYNNLPSSEQYHQHLADEIIKTEEIVTDNFTPNQIKRIITTFDKNFRICVYKEPLLVEFYHTMDINSIGDAVKSISNMIENNGKISKNIYDLSVNIDNKIDTIKDFINRCLISIVCIIIATSIQSIFYFIFREVYDSALILISCACFAMSELLTYFFIEQFNVSKLLALFNFKYKKETLFMQFILPIALSLSGFWIIYNVTYADSLLLKAALYYMLGMTIGHIIGILLKLYLIKQKKYYF